jgi:hypothetical protein
LKLPTYQATNLPNVPGWLLCVFLLLLQPISVGLSAAAALDAVILRGFPALAILLVRLLVTAVGVGAGLALLGRRAGAVSFTRLALIAAAATDLFIYLTPFYPNHRAPGETPLWVAGTFVIYGGLLGCLAMFSRRDR